TVLLAGTAAAATVAAQRIPLDRRGSPAAVTAALVVLLTASAVAIGHYGSRPGFSGRGPLWRQAWHDWEAHPALGSGAGTFEQFWLRHRRISANARDAHSLYLETLAELGPLGLGLLAATLALASFAFVGLIGNGALAASARAADSERWQESASQARKAIRWLPWSADAWRRLGLAQAGQGDEPAARASLAKAISKSPEEW